MKEIDFIPDWYKSSRRQEISCRVQYAALAVIFVVMMLWNLTTSHSISRAEQKITDNISRQTMSEGLSQELNKMKTGVMRLQEKENALERIDAKISIPNILAEMSYLISKKIVISNITFQAEEFVNDQSEKSGMTAGVRSAKSYNIVNNASSSPIGEVRFRIVISGVAASAGDVAELVCNMENSTYFCQVIPSFSRNRKMRSHGNLKQKKYKTSEFEIICYLANYQQGGASLGNKL